MNTRRKQRLFAVSAILVLLSLAVYLVASSLSDNIDAFFTPSEVINGKEKTGVMPTIGQRIRIGGLVVPGSVTRNEDNLQVSFDLVDLGPSVTVKYTGILPDLFREGQGIIATGILSSEKTIDAHEVFAKHDEEYMPPELAEKMKGIKHVPPSKAEY